MSLNILAASICSNLSIYGLGLVNSVFLTLDLLEALSCNIDLCRSLSGFFSIVSAADYSTLYGSYSAY